MPDPLRIGLVLTVLCTLSLPVMAATPREAELRHMLEQDCGSCHGLTRKGGLGTPLTPTALQDRSDEYLVHVIRHGIPGKPMPPWGPLLSEEDIQILIRLLRHGDPS